LSLKQKKKGKNQTERLRGSTAESSIANRVHIYAANRQIMEYMFNVHTSFKKEEEKVAVDSLSSLRNKRGG
jgi:hypothetical protein